MTLDVLRSPLRSTLLTRRSIFVSYHHDRDQAYYDSFSRIFCDLYGVIRDNSVDQELDSDNAEYVMRRIREKYITGTSCTFVLCGSETRWRKYVDWEIKATLDKEHGLIGVNLPYNPRDYMGRVNKPERLQNNIDSGYAIWIAWENLAGGSSVLRSYVEQAIARPKSVIRNDRPMRSRNGP
ncbi:MAG: TIR domain-containing protein [Acidiferrobacterales bacterium]